MLNRLRFQLAAILSPQLLDQRNRARREALTDPLTGLANRRAFDLATATAHTDTQIVLFDLNNFGAVNKMDRHGHAEGDRLLKLFAATLTIVATDYDVAGRVFRIGGDEFAIIASARNEPVAIRTRVEHLFGEHTYYPVHVSATGVIGPSYRAADAILQERKRERKTA